MFYYGARLLADGRPMYGSPVEYGIPWHLDHMGNLNPPHFQTLLQPLALFSYARAFELWSITNVFALVLSLALVVRYVACEADAGESGCLGVLRPGFRAVHVGSRQRGMVIPPLAAVYGCLGAGSQG